MREPGHNEAYKHHTINPKIYIHGLIESTHDKNTLSLTTWTISQQDYKLIYKGYYISITEIENCEFFHNVRAINLTPKWATLSIAIYHHLI